LHQPEFPGVPQLSAAALSETLGATLSILKPVALMPELQFPATSQTEPDAIDTELPLVDEDCVKLQDAPEQGLVTPEVESVAVKPAVCEPLHQPEFPGEAQLLAPALSETPGATLSSFTVADALDPGPAPLLVALSVAVQLTFVVPSLETVIGALAVCVPDPVIVPTVAPVQLIAVTLLPPFEESSAVTVPVAGELLNQPFEPSGVKLTVTAGASWSVITVYEIVIEEVPVESVPIELLLADGST
jgi:hypothetical protein